MAPKADLSDARHGTELRSFPGVPGPDQRGSKYREEADLYGICMDHLNNDFEHQCFEAAVKELGAVCLEPVEGDMNDHVFYIPGIPAARFLPHQVWGIGWVL